MDVTNPIQYLSFPRQNASDAQVVCYSSSMTSTIGVWRKDNPFTYSIPLFILQIILAVLISHLVHFLLRPLKMPRHISNTIAGILVGPSAFGRNQYFTESVFPLRSLVIFDLFGHVGLIFYMFSLGVEIDINMVRRGGTRTVAFAAACLVPPFAIGSISSFVVQPHIGEGIDKWAFILFLGVALSVTTFSVLVRLLAELKLVGADVGCLTLSSAILNSSCTWFMLIFAVALAQSNGNYVASLWTLVAGIAFLIVTIMVMRPVVDWVIKRTPEGKEPEELYTSSLLVGVMLWALFSDCIGTHPIFGAFIYGVVIPNGPLGQALIEKTENFITGLLMPLFFIVNGLRTNIFSFRNWHSIMVLALASLASAASKVAGSAAMAIFYEMPMQDGVSLGLLMNTHGVIELIILNIARNKLVIGDQTFTVLVLMSIFITLIINPLLNIVVKPSRRMASYKRHTIQWPNPDSELRLLVCVHGPRQVAALLALLKVSNPTKRSPFFVYALHLIELAGRASTMLVLDYASPLSPTFSGKESQQSHGAGSHNRLKAQSDHIFQAFETYEQRAGGVSVQFLTSISAYTTMYEDIVAAAQDKHAAVIILPFHKQKTVDGGMQVYHPCLRALNQKVLASSPCSVGVLVDHGLAGNRSIQRVMLLFFGGKDDREGLALASRMACNPENKVSVLRFIYSPGSPTSSMGGSAKYDIGTTVDIDEDHERKIDDMCMEEFMARWGRGIVDGNEVMVSNAEETIKVIKEVEETQDLFIVGRGDGRESALTKGLTEWSECPELGPIGDLLASTDFAMSTSVLVVQQGAGMTSPERDSVAREISTEVRLYPNKADNRNYNSTMVGERLMF